MQNSRLPRPCYGPVRYRTEELVESLQDQIGFLRRELERKDAILLRMAERIPELEASAEPRYNPKAATEGEAGTETPANDAGQSRASWWRRFFGFAG